MPTVFTAREIAETAVEKEGKRRDFYASVARRSEEHTSELQSQR